MYSKYNFSNFKLPIPVIDVLIKNDMYIDYITHLANVIKKYNKHIDTKSNERINLHTDITSNGSKKSYITIEDFSKFLDSVDSRELVSFSKYLIYVVDGSVEEFDNYNYKQKWLDLIWALNNVYRIVKDLEYFESLPKGEMGVDGIK